MNIFPTKKLYFKLHDTQTKTLDQLQRRTKKSEKLVTYYTDKSFIGTIKGNNFHLISSTIGKGAFCVMKGKIDANKGYVHVEIHKAFRILITIMICLIPIGLSIVFFTDKEQFSFLLIIVAIIQILIIRFIAVELAFKFLSRNSLQRLRDVLDADWIRQNEY
ncbi:hypothetical protein [uncultured Kordia sp.]|uniref:hypothetical protein n=1 Tax=uncultured Kordia sp. TaxID=507699 RepID=UPI00262F75A8|nr:hypothetical protein [uncultured Kordia sp.]